MNQSLYIITHKEVKNIYPQDRKIMMVGAKNKDIPLGYNVDYDKTLPNISAKNVNYCELTGLYYFYQNEHHADVFGLEHYRRLFVKHKLYFFHYPFLRAKDIAKILRRYDIIVPKPTYLETTLYQNYANAHVIGDLDKVIKIIKTRYPEYMDSVNNVLSHNKVYLCNMFIGKAEVVKKYCDWLFDILFALEKEIDFSGRDDYQKRVFGFLSERMFTIWLDKNQQYQKYESAITFIENDVPLFNILKKVKRKIGL